MLTVSMLCLKGSAADIIKIAMICLHDVIGEDSEALCPSFIDAEKCQLLKGRCRILLQVIGLYIPRGPKHLCLLFYFNINIIALTVSGKL